ncbi:MAG: hypothetical protein P8Z77_16545, partial [Candidatus Thiodiazotropha sp.]
EVGFAVARRKRDGQFGKGRSTSLPSYPGYFTVPDYLRREDEEIVSLLSASGMTFRGGVSLKGVAGSLALKLMLKTGRVFWGGQRERPLQQASPREMALIWREENKRFHLRVDAPDGLHLVPVEPPLFIDAQRHEAGELILPAGIDSEWLRQLDMAPPIPRKEAKRASRWLALSHPELPTPLPIEITDLGQPTPRPRLTLGQSGDSPLQTPLTLDFLYEEIAVDGQRVEPILTVEQGDALVRFQRDAEAEAVAAEQLRREGLIDLQDSPMQFVFPHHGAGRQADLAAWFQFAETGLARLREAGWVIEQDARSPIRLSRAERIDAEVEGSGIDWFELRFDLEVDGRRLPLLPLVSALIGEYEPGGLPPSLYFPCGEGHYVEVESQRIEPILQTLIELYDNLGEAGGLRLSRLDAPRLQEFGEIEIRGGEALQRLAAKLRDFDGIKAAAVPARIRTGRHPGRRHGAGQDGADPGPPGDRKARRAHAPAEPHHRPHQPDG